jgi:hypothetical protein
MSSLGLAAGVGSSRFANMIYRKLVVSEWETANIGWIKVQ